MADHRQNEAEDRVYEVEGVDVNADRQDDRSKGLLLFQGMKKKDQRGRRRVPT